MTKPDFDALALMDASAKMLELDLRPADLAVVKQHLETAARMAGLVLDFPLDDEGEPAPVYTP